MNHLCTVIWLAWKDLWHDRRMTVCLVLTVASIAVPLLLFFGLKNGAVQVLRQRMLNDPAYMELIPQGTGAYNAGWLEQWRANPRVGFLVPRTRELAVSGEFARADAKGKAVNADMLPTAPGDWLLQSYGLTVPEADTCVLSAPLAEKIGAEAGTALRLRIRRVAGKSEKSEKSGTENAERTFRVHAVLPKQADGLMQAYVPLAQIEHMEAFRDGHAVPEFGWPGQSAGAQPVFHALLLLTAEPPDAVFIARIQQRAGFVSVQETSAALPVPVALPPGTTPGTTPELRAFRLQAGTTPADTIKLNELRNLLRGQNAHVIPLAEKSSDALPLRVTFPVASRPQELSVRATALWTAFPGQPDPPQEENWFDPASVPLTLVVNPTLAKMFSGESTTATFTAEASDNSLVLPVRLVPEASVSPDEVWAAPGLVGVLNHLHDRRLDVRTSPDGQTRIQLGRRDYPRFRMYAVNLDAVAPLAAELESAGIQVSTRAADIERVRLMDHYLSVLFGVIAIGSVIGGGVCLLASLYAGVERKRRELAVLRLLGVHGGILCVFPLTGGLIMTGFGLLVGLGCFHGLGLLINSVAADFTLSGETVCTLEVSQQVGAVLLGLATAMVAGLAAALRLLSIEPAECLRDE